MEDASILQRFMFQKPIILEDTTEKGVVKVIAEEDKITITLNAPDELALILALSGAKLGEIDPLLICPVFSRWGISDEDYRKCVNIFMRATRPLKSAWIFKMMRKYMPEVYELYLEAAIGMIDGLLHVKKLDLETLTLMLELIAIVFENPDCYEYLTNENFAVAELIRYANQNPNVESYIRLYNETDSTYNIGLATSQPGDKGRLFYFTKKEHISEQQLSK